MHDLSFQTHVQPSSYDDYMQRIILLKKSDHDSPRSPPKKKPSCGQQELTKVAEIGKKRTFKNAHFWLKSRQIAVIFKFEYFHNEISYEVIRHGIWKLKHPFSIEKNLVNI